MPEVRRIGLTWLLTAIVVVLFLWMVRQGADRGDPRRSSSRRTCGRSTWRSRRTERADAERGAHAARRDHPGAGRARLQLYRARGRPRLHLDAPVRGRQPDRRIHPASPVPRGRERDRDIRRYVLFVSDYGTKIPAAIKEAVVDLSVAATIFLLTAAYVFTDADSIVSYVASKVPQRYDRLRESLVTNVSGVLYGAIYSTLLTQSLKTLVIFLMNLVFGVPLAAVLAILSFIIGFFPIVGSWSVYVPVAAWLLVFRDSPVKAGLMVLVGFLVNTLFISTYLRPKIAAERSGVLNFYWMFVALVTGVYTFGLAGILLGPILIGLLKAVVDSVTSQTSWRLLDAEDGAG